MMLGQAETVAKQLLCCVVRFCGLLVQIVAYNSRMQ